MDDYTEIGRERLETQAKRGLEGIRCPLDSAMMLVTDSVAGKTENGEVSYRDFEDLPTGSEWTVMSVHLQCSACRRRVSDIPVNRSAADLTAAVSFRGLLR